MSYEKSTEPGAAASVSDIAAALHEHATSGLLTPETPMARRDGPAGLFADETLWDESAPEKVLAAYAAGDVAAGWKAWKKHLLRRKKPLPPAKLCKSKHSMLNWGSADLPISRRLGWLLTLLGRRHGSGNASAAIVAANAETWLEEFGGAGGESVNGSGSAHDSGWALECLGWSHLLVARINLFQRDLWWRVLERLLHAAVDARVPLGDNPLAHQLVRGELRLTLAYSLPELKPCRQLLPLATEALSVGIEELLDGEGLPQQQYLAMFRPLIACWTRCRLMGGHLDDGCWNASAEEQFPLAVREAWRLTRQDGTCVLSPLESAPVATECTLAGSQNGNTRSIAGGAYSRRDFRWLAEVASELVKNKHNRRIANLTVSSQRKQAAPKIKLTQFPSPAVYSEWSELAVLRSDWTSRADRLSVAFQQDQTRIEVALGSELLFSGNWDFEVQANGAVAAPIGPWREVCWLSDRDCDYLELEIELAGAVKMQRQMLLARNDQFLLLADAVLADETQDFSYRGQLPLVSGVETRSADESTELFLRAAKRRALALPLALSEWRREARGCSLSATGSQLTLSQIARGQSLYAPLWIDLSKRRADKPFTWRRLTVAQQRVNLARDIATGYRVQFGRRQWLVYRSLTAPANRTVLGQNLSTDFLCARFGRDGETQTIIEIE